MKPEVIFTGLVAALLTVLAIYFVPGFFSVTAVQAMIVIFSFLLAVMAAKLGYNISLVIFAFVTIAFFALFFIPGTQFSVPVPSFPNEF